MAFPMLNIAAAAALLFVFALARIELSSCQFVRAKVACLDCNQDYAFSGIKVLVKCDKVKKLAMATTEDDGSFEVELPSDSTNISKSSDHLPVLNCHAKLLGGPTQLYSSRKSMVSRIIETHEKPNSYTISTPLSFYTACPTTYTICRDMHKFGSSKNINLPLPAEWGLAPSSFYIPCFPIVTGIP
ncbi:uncharacterized protein LOC121240092 [Juglans microcarpa x Juglans regia]|uniref:uncharacterized protein LOC121240092 n=1 Tax=Juglans microcarpa x Juglans regia TaxID=2249226 RepID=UPI001B7E0612|nr:uncharacterized protein LOC121240092 [Juglans microcarpa x Juglans regia]